MNLLRLCMPLSALLLATIGSSATVDLYATGASYHAEERDRARLSAWNPGAGLGVSTPLASWLDATAAGIFYRDSYRRRAVILGAGLRAIAGDRSGPHASLALLPAYVRGSDQHGVLPIPVAGLGWGPLSVEATGHPGESVLAVWLRLGVRL